MSKYEAVEHKMRNFVEANCDLVLGQTNGQYTPNGDAYITFTTGGVKKEGFKHRVLALDLAKAVELFETEFIKYVKTLPVGKRYLWWRVYPEVTRSAWEEKGAFNTQYMFTVRARFLVTNEGI